MVAPWEPEASLCDASGSVRVEFIGAALDCPGAFSFEPQPGNAFLLGQLHVEVTAGRRYVIAGWEIECEGRKHFVGTALYDEASNLVAKARATWIEVPAQQ